MIGRPLPLIWLILMLFAFATPALAGGHHYYAYYRSHYHRHYHRHGYHTSRYAWGVARSWHGRIKRSAEAKDEFKREYPCPSTGKTRGACPGYVIDHIYPLKRGGADAPYNMQWQTVEDAKAKDKWE